MCIRDRSVDPVGLLAQLDIAHRRTPELHPRAPGGHGPLTVGHTDPNQLAKLLPGVAASAQSLPQGRQLLSADVPEGGHQEVLAVAEVVLQRADRHTTGQAHIGEPRRVGASLSNHSGRGSEDRHLPSPRTATTPNPDGRGANLDTSRFRTLHPYDHTGRSYGCLLYTSPSPRDGLLSR